MNIDEIKKPWEKRVNDLIEDFVKSQLGIMTIERWQAMRKDFYNDVKLEMAKSGNNFFFPKNMAKLTQIRTPSDEAILKRIDKGWSYVVQMASMNEMDKVMGGLGLIEKMRKVLDGPFSYEIFQLDGNSGFIVKVPEA